jgi:hypothetical protein
MPKAAGSIVGCLLWAKSSRPRPLDHPAASRHELSFDAREQALVAQSLQNRGRLPAMPKLLATIVVLSATMLAGCGPSDEEMAAMRQREEKVASDFKQSWDKRRDDRAAAERECVQRKQRLNPTWSEGYVEQECTEEASKRPWR